MCIFDFEYDGLYLSDFGYIVCKFGSDGLQTISNGTELDFHTVSTFNGAKHELISAEYRDCVTTTLQICKNSCQDSNMEMSRGDFRDLTSWLNRKDFHKLKFICDDDEYADLYFEASFNISRIEIDGRLYGLELEVITNRPYALLEPRVIMIKNLVENGEKTIQDVSDEEGYIYPHMEIQINQSGNFSIYNDLEQRLMLINNCSVGEVITVDYPIIQSSLNSHKIQDDFNWSFFRIANTFKNKVNNLTISLPCTIKIVYSPVVKLGL